MRSCTRKEYSCSMRSIISSIWREECFAGGAHSQVCRLEPAPRGAVSAVRYRIIKPGSTAWPIRRASCVSCRRCDAIKSTVYCAFAKELWRGERLTVRVILGTSV